MTNIRLGKAKASSPVHDAGAQVNLGRMMDTLVVLEFADEPEAVGVPLELEVTASSRVMPLVDLEFTANVAVVFVEINLRHVELAIPADDQAPQDGVIERQARGVE